MAISSSHCRVMDDGIGKKAAPGKDGERVAERDEVAGNCLGGLGRFHDQPLEVMDSVVAVGQRVQQCLDDAQNIRRQPFKRGNEREPRAEYRGIQSPQGGWALVQLSRFGDPVWITASIRRLTETVACGSIHAGEQSYMKRGCIAGCVIGLSILLGGCSDTPRRWRTRRQPIKRPLRTEKSRGPRVGLKEPG